MAVGVGAKRTANLGQADEGQQEARFYEAGACVHRVLPTRMRRWVRRVMPFSALDAG